MSAHKHASQHRLPRRLLAILLVAAAVGLVLGARQVRYGEAGIQALLLRVGGLEARHVMTSVVVSIDGRPAGISLAGGCSIGPLLALFLLACAPFVWYRAMSVPRVLLSVAQLALALVVANEIRIAAILLSMRRWGFERGYEFSHVFLGSAITTVGFVAGAVLFARLFVSAPRRSAP